MSIKNIFKKKWVRLVISLFVTGIAFWLCFRKVDWAVLRASFSSVQFFWVVFALANVVLSVFVLGIRWRILLKPEVEVSLGRLFRFNVISQYTNIVFPARFGEVVRVYLVSKQYKVRAGYAMGTVFIEKFFDFIVFIAFWIFLPILFAIEQQVKGYLAALLFCAIAVVVLIFIILKPEIFLKLLGKISKFFPGKYQKKIYVFFESGIEAFQQLKSSLTILLIFGLTLVFLTGQAVTNFMLFKAFGLEIPFWGALLILFAIQVGNIPPSVPGKLGVFEYAVILALSIFGISKDVALGYGIMLHLVAYLPKIVLGQIYLVRPAGSEQLAVGSKPGKDRKEGKSRKIG